MQDEDVPGVTSCAKCGEADPTARCEREDCPNPPDPRPLAEKAKADALEASDGDPDVTDAIDYLLGQTVELADAVLRPNALLTRGHVVAIMQARWQDPAGFHEDVARALGIEEHEYAPAEGA